MGSISATPVPGKTELGAVLRCREIARASSDHAPRHLPGGTSTGLTGIFDPLADAGQPSHILGARLLVGDRGIHGSGTASMPMNYAKTGLLLAVLTGILVAMGGLVGGATGMVIAFAVALAMNLFSLWQSDKLVLRMYGAEEVTEQSGGQYYAIVRDLVARARAADAARLHHEQPAAQRLRHRAQSAERGRVRLHGPARDAVAGGSCGRHGARAGAREELRHA